MIIIQSQSYKEVGIKNYRLLHLICIDNILLFVNAAFSNFIITTLSIKTISHLLQAEEKHVASTSSTWSASR